VVDVEAPIVGVPLPPRSGEEEGEGSALRAEAAGGAAADDDEDDDDDALARA
jgi:hypothetical protein